MLDFKFRSKSWKLFKICILSHHNIFPRKWEASAARLHGGVIIVPSSTWPAMWHIVLFIKYVWIVGELLGNLFMTLWSPNIPPFSICLSLSYLSIPYRSVLTRQWFPQTPLIISVSFSWCLFSFVALILSTVTRPACKIPGN